MSDPLLHSNLLKRKFCETLFLSSAVEVTVSQNKIITPPLFRRQSKLNLTTDFLFKLRRYFSAILSRTQIESRFNFYQVGMPYVNYKQ